MMTMTTNCTKRHRRRRTPLTSLPNRRSTSRTRNVHTQKIRAALTGRSSGSTRTLTRKATHFGVWVSSTTRSSRRRSCPRIDVLLSAADCISSSYDAQLELFQQIGGFFNRLETSRKYLFGSVGVLGTTKNSIIPGALIARGQEIRLVVEVAPDWESYT